MLPAAPSQDPSRSDYTTDASIWNQGAARIRLFRKTRSRPQELFFHPRFLWF